VPSAFLERAKAGFQLEDPVEFNTTINNNILRAQDIIRELDYSLNVEQGGELAHPTAPALRLF
jgi:flagellin-specific chaperone FliS